MISGLPVCFILAASDPRGLRMRPSAAWALAMEVPLVPTLHREAGYAFEMVMFDCQEPRHVHVKGNGRAGAKFWLAPGIEIATPGGYNPREVAQVRRIIQANLATMIRRWDEECARVQASEEAR
jgi:hypothetical protein